MYNKLFTKILDSSVWLEPTPTRIVWVTLIAAMDQTGFCAFAAIGNVANRARVSVGEATIALECLESPDVESGDKDHEGRRVERVPGGWLVLNADKYRALITTAVQRDQTRERVRRHRARNAVTAVTESLPVTRCNRSEALALAEAETEAEKDEYVDRAQPARPTPRNPHAKPTNLINGASQRRHGSHAWCNQRGLCVTPWVHEELVGKRGGPQYEAELKLWYDAEIAGLNGEAIGDEPDTFWRNRFAAKWPPVTRKATPKKASIEDQAAELSAHLKAKGLK